jgi:chemotaxis protein CheZ
MAQAKAKAKTPKGGGELKNIEISKDLSLLDIMKFAETMANQMQTFHEALDASLFREFREISRFISNMRSEIGRLQAHDLSETRIPRAGEELDAIVESTEEATNTIMESAEAIMSADPEDVKAYQDAVNEHIMKIFEACSFQDLTGQRISKVVEALQHVEERVNHFANAIGAFDDEEFLTDEEKAREERRKELILHGPQKKGEGIEQGDIDALLSEGEKKDASASADADSGQDDIDAMFD